MKGREIKRGQIYWVNLGKGDESVQQGLRPCIVVSNNVGNYFGGTVIVAPLTSKIKPLRVHPEIEGVRGKDSIVLTEQLRTVNKKSLGDYIREATAEETEDLNNALLIELGLKEF